jgi:hypothetical protein
MHQTGYADPVSSRGDEAAMPEPDLTPDAEPDGSTPPRPRPDGRRARHQLDQRDDWVRQAQQTPSLREILSCDEWPDGASSTG